MNVGYPKQSRILNMALAEKAGGWGQIKKWKSTDDAGYKKLSELIDKALPPIKKRDYDFWRKQNTPGYQTAAKGK